MADESWNRGTDGTGCQAPESHRLCANNCGFFGSSATLNLCSKCYRDFCLKEEQASSARAAVEKSLNISSTTTTTSTTPETLQTSLPEKPITPTTLPSSSSSSPLHLDFPQPPNRCSSCRKRVGLTGFRCRCGFSFCPSHRYPEQHSCTFDFKSTGREAIAKANPIVKAEKLDKI